MEDRFNFNAIVTGYYDIDTPDEYAEFEPQIYLENVDIWSGGDIGISRDDLELAIKNQYPNLEKSQFNQIMKFFEDNSIFSDNEAYLTILPHKIIQCTGLKDKNGKLIYEGDIVNVYVSSEKLYRYQVKFEIGSFMLVSNEEIFDFPNKWNDNVYPLSQLYFEYENEDYCIEQLEVIGNVYENPELLEVGKGRSNR